jgi:hypothetical protein
MPYLGGFGEEKKDFTEIGVYNCPNYPDKEQMVDYVVSSWLDGISEARDQYKKTKISAWIRPGTKVYLADNEFGDWREIIKNKDELDNIGRYDVWNSEHLPMGLDGNRRVAKARHNKGTDRDTNENIGCNYLFLDGHSDWMRAKDSTEKYWQPGKM